MSSEIKNRLKALYEVDEYLWLEETINLLRTNNLQELDVENLIEELESLGRRDLNRVRSLLRQIIVHLLFLQYWREESERNERHWKGEITAFRADLNDHLTASLENKLDQDLESIYGKALKIVLQKTDLSLDLFPENCPYSLEELLDENWFPVTETPE